MALGLSSGLSSILPPESGRLVSLSQTNWTMSALSTMGPVPVECTIGEPISTWASFRQFAPK